MLSNRLIVLISENTDKLGEQWARRVKKTEQMKEHHKLLEKELKKRNVRFFSNLAKWFEEGATHDKIKDYFNKIGGERYHEGIPLGEVHFGFIIAKSILWNLILSKGLFQSSQAIFQALEMITMIYNYFDLGFFHVGEEYMEEMCKRIRLSKKFTDEELEDCIFSCTVSPERELKEVFENTFNARNMQS